MAPRSLPDASYLRECFNYDPATGVLTWRVRPPEHFHAMRRDPAWVAAIFNGNFAGKEAGKGSRYGLARLDGRLCYAHRLIWKMLVGVDPPSEIDHIDGDKTNNRWANLRVATHMQNAWNVPRDGVEQNGSGWMARIRIAGRRIYLGTFRTKGEAAAAYRRAAEEHQGGFASHLSRL